jgi:type IV secretory pathway TraG/TraD family ATPase VirD4
MNNLGNPNSNPLVQLLSSGSQNIVAQIMSSLSQQFNTMNNQSVNQAVSSNDRDFSRIIKRILFLDGISAASISISPLGSQSLEQVNFI